MTRIGLNLTGRLGTAPCGHPGEFLIGQYVRCLIPNCDGAASTGPRCDRCSSPKMEPFDAPNIPAGAAHCVACGHVRWGGVTVEDDGA